MNDQPAFETRLARTFAAYADAAPVEVDAVGLASAIVRGSRRGSLFSRWLPIARPLAPIVITLLLLAALAAAGLVASQLLRPRVDPYREVLVQAGQMTAPRADAVVVQLDDGRVLIAAGRIVASPNPFPAEVFDPATGESVAIEGGPSGFVGTGTLLRDGRALMIVYDSNATSSRAYVFDPVAMAIRQLPQAGFSNSPPFGVTPSMTTLADGRALVSGGKVDVYESQLLDTALVYDPSSDAFAPTGAMAVARRGHAMVPLADGRILVAGGEGAEPGDVYAPLLSAEVYDPTTGIFSRVADMRQAPGHAAGVLLGDGRVAIVPVAPPSDQVVLQEDRDPGAIQLYDPVAGTFTGAVSLPHPVARAHLLRDGRVLLTGARYDPSGGFDHWTPWAAIFDPSTGTVAETAAPRTQSPGSVVLRDGRVLFAGGRYWPERRGEPLNVNWLDVFE